MFSWLSGLALTGWPDNQHAIYGLKYRAAGAWSRRLTQEHRIVYLVSGDRIDFLQGRYHD